MRSYLRRFLTVPLAVLLSVSLALSGAAADPEAPTAPTLRAIYTVDTESETYARCDEAVQTIAASQVFLYDATLDEILYEKGSDTGKLYPASITKLFSAYVAMQYLRPEESVTAGDELALVREGSSVAYISRGHRLQVGMLIEAMLLPSGNDAAMVVAAAAGRRIADDPGLDAADAVQRFVAEMNRQANNLGFERTHFTNPDGYHVGSHYTCIPDMARIAALALTNDTIRQYMGVLEEDVEYLSGQTNHWKNTNKLLDPEDGYYRPDCFGMKTGSTSQAGYCLMSAFQVGGHTVVVGVFGAPDDNARFAAAIKLIRACQDAIRALDIPK